MSQRRSPVNQSLFLNNSAISGKATVRRIAIPTNTQKHVIERPSALRPGEASLQHIADAYVSNDQQRVNLLHRTSVRYPTMPKQEYNLLHNDQPTKYHMPSFPFNPENEQLPLSEKFKMSMASYMVDLSPSGRIIPMLPRPPVIKTPTAVTPYAWYPCQGYAAWISSPDCKDIRMPCSHPSSATCLQCCPPSTIARLPLWQDIPRSLHLRQLTSPPENISGRDQCYYWTQPGVVQGYQCYHGPLWERNSVPDMLMTYQHMLMQQQVGNNKTQVEWDDVVGELGVFGKWTNALSPWLSFIMESMRQSKATTKSDKACKQLLHVISMVAFQYWCMMQQRLSRNRLAPSC